MDEILKFYVCYLPLHNSSYVVCTEELHAISLTQVYKYQCEDYK